MRPSTCGKRDCRWPSSLAESQRSGGEALAWWACGDEVHRKEGLQMTALHLKYALRQVLEAVPCRGREGLWVQKARLLDSVESEHACNRQGRCRRRCSGAHGCLAADKPRGRHKALRRTPPHGEFAWTGAVGGACGARRGKWVQGAPDWLPPADKRQRRGGHTPRCQAPVAWAGRPATRCERIDRPHPAHPAPSMRAGSARLAARVLTPGRLQSDERCRAH
jgi:hypothetical protein